MEMVCHSRNLLWEEIWLAKFPQIWPDDCILTRQMHLLFIPSEDLRLLRLLMPVQRQTRCKIFFGWANAKMTTEYISTSKAAVKNLASKLQGREVQVSSEKASIQEPREVQEQDHTEQFSGDSKVDLWEEPDWNPTQEEMKQMKAADFLCGKPVRIQAGAKVYFINNIESFHC